jgi:hypothetical protein
MPMGRRVKQLGLGPSDWIWAEHELIASDILKGVYPFIQRWGNTLRQTWLSGESRFGSMLPPLNLHFVCGLVRRHGYGCYGVKMRHFEWDALQELQRGYIVCI